MDLETKSPLAVIGMNLLTLSSLTRNELKDPYCSSGQHSTQQGPGPGLRGTHPRS